MLTYLTQLNVVSPSLADNYGLFCGGVDAYRCVDVVGHWGKSAIC